MEGSSTTEAHNNQNSSSSFKIVGVWNASCANQASTLPPPKLPNAIRFICLSDTHCGHSKLEVPAGDVLLHAGDFCTVGTPEELDDFACWLDTLPHSIKIVIAGNHDAVLDEASFGKHITHQKILQSAAEKALCNDVAFAALDASAQKAAVRRKERELLTALPALCKARLQRSCIYLENSSVKIAGGVCVYGSPWVPGPPHWAFAKQRAAEELKTKWDAIPGTGVHIFLTHTPPLGIQSRGSDANSASLDAGCEFLRAALTRCQPLVNVCGHQHNLYGVYPPTIPEHTLVINAATQDCRRPIIFDLVPNT